MTKSPAPTTSAPRLCPTCGTRVGSAATKCLVCGADLSTTGASRPVSRARAGAAPGRPLRIPWAVVILVVLVLVGVGLGAALLGGGEGGVLAGLLGGGSRQAADVTPTVAPTSTAPPTFTPQPTATDTPEPTATPLPPQEYRVVAGDTCLKIAAEFNVSFQSIITLNGLDPNCTLSVGQTLMIPQPTATPTPLPTATLGASVATQVPRATYTVHAGDTLLGIANFYGLSVSDLMEVNGITDPTSIREGQVLIIPLERVITPGPSPTPTPPPPWPAPNQLLPTDGATFSGAEAVISLQWTSVGTLRPNEYYYVVLEDVTCNCARFHRQATFETKLIVPAEFRPEDAAVHVYRWTVTTVRQRATSGATPEYDPAGATSPSRVFSWVLGAAP
jgi:LysM repeat protein